MQNVTGGMKRTRNKRHISSQMFVVGRKVHWDTICESFCRADSRFCVHKNCDMLSNEITEKTRILSQEVGIWNTNLRLQGVRPKLCEGPDEKTEECNTNPCDMQWSEWSNCSAICGRGSRQRMTMCALSSGGNLKTCRELGLDNQDFEHIEDCNTWDKANCPRCALT